jgi:hypothetical protein
MKNLFLCIKIKWVNILKLKCFAGQVSVIEVYNNSNFTLSSFSSTDFVEMDEKLTSLKYLQIIK